MDVEKKGDAGSKGLYTSWLTLRRKDEAKKKCERSSCTFIVHRPCGGDISNKKCIFHARINGDRSYSGGYVEDNIL